MKTSVVIPTRNGVDRIRRVLRSLDSEGQIIVVDNGSSDGTADVLAQEFPDVDVISLPRNEGFSRAVNRAARVATGEALVLLNDDCVCEPGFVSLLGGGLDSRRGVTMAAGVLLDVAHPHLIDTAGMELDETLLVFDYLHGQSVTVLRPAPPSPIGPSGAAAALLRDAFLEVGGFDEALFAYWEDVDLVLRLRETGSECRLVPEARALHAHSSTLGSGSAEKNYLIGFGRGYLLRKWRVLKGAKAARALALDSAICLGQLAIDRNAAGFRGRARGWRAASSVCARDLPAAVDRTLPPADLLRELRRRGRRRGRLRDRRKPA